MESISIIHTLVPSASTYSCQWTPDSMVVLPDPAQLALAARDYHTAAMKKAIRVLAAADSNVQRAAAVYLSAFQHAGLLSAEERQQLEVISRQVILTQEDTKYALERVTEIFVALLDGHATPMAILLAGGAVSSLELVMDGTVAAGKGIAAADWIGALGGGSVGAGVGSSGGPYGTAAGAVLGGSIGLAAGSIAAAFS